MCNGKKREIDQSIPRLCVLRGRNAIEVSAKRMNRNLTEEVPLAQNQKYASVLSLYQIWN